MPTALRRAQTAPAETGVASVLRHHDQSDTAALEVEATHEEGGVDEGAPPPPSGDCLCRLRTQNDYEPNPAWSWAYMERDDASADGGMRLVGNTRFEGTFALDATGMVPAHPSVGYQ